MFGKSNVNSVAPLNRSQINEEMRIRGIIAVCDPIVMAGQLDGDIKADTLHLLLKAIIAKEVTGQSVTIDGTVLESAVTDKAYLSANEYFEGPLQGLNFAIDNGAYVDARFTKVPAING